MRFEIYYTLYHVNKVYTDTVNVPFLRHVLYVVGNTIIAIVQ